MRRQLGYIKERKKGVWDVKVSLGRDPSTGKYRYQWFTVRGSRHIAEMRLAEIQHQVKAGVYTITGKTTVAQYLNRWLAEYAKPNLTPRSYERYESIVRVHLVPDIGSIQLTKLRPEHIQKHYAAMLEKGLSPLSVRYHHTVLHKALQTAIKWGTVSRNAADGVDAPRVRQGDIQTWDESEVITFLESCRGTHYYALFYLALFTGMRRGELLALRWQDIDFVYSQISVNRSIHHLEDGSYIFTQPKTKKSRRTIALSPSAFLMLDSYRKAKEIELKMMDQELKDGDLVFNTLGKPWRPNTVSRAWTIMAARAGVKVIRLHDARHTHASLMLKQGIHPKIVQERLGHSTISITLDTYSHVAPGLQEAAAKRFDESIFKDRPSVNIEIKSK